MIRSSSQPRRLRSDQFPRQENLPDLSTENSSRGNVPDTKFSSRKEKMSLAIELGVTDLEIQVLSSYSL